MSGADDSAEKEHEPSQKRLDDARAKGDIAKSADLNTAAAYGGLILAAMTFGPASLQQFGNLSMGLLDQADTLAPLLVSQGGAQMGGLLFAVIKVGAPWFLIPAGAVFLAVLAQRSLVFAPDKLEPKLSRINPFSTAKQKFGREGLFEFTKSLVKLIVVSVILGLFLVRNLPDILGSMNLSPGIATALLLNLVLHFLFVILVITGSFGALDYLWQRSQLIRRNRMSRQELIDEARQSDGDPHMKQQRRHRGQEIAMNRMMLDVPTADVIIVNPTHYAVALRWTRKDKGAPICIAKGTDEIAARIRASAAIAGVPLHRDPATARAIHASVEIGQEIQPDQYPAVAAAIRFAERMRGRAKRQPAA